MGSSVERDGLGWGEQARLGGQRGLSEETSYELWTE